jgi:hypothetical protein
MCVIFISGETKKKKKKSTEIIHTHTHTHTHTYDLPQIEIQNVILEIIEGECQCKMCSYDGVHHFQQLL